MTSRSSTGSWVRWLRARAGRRRRDERGGISVFAAVGVIALMVAIGLVVDGGGKVRAQQEARAVATEAARAGGQAVEAGAAVRGTATRLDAVAAQGAAQEYLSSAGVSGSARVVDGTTLEVTTSNSYSPVFLSMVGVGPQGVSGSARVRLVRGLGEEIP